MNNMLETNKGNDLKKIDANLFTQKNEMNGLLKIITEKIAIYREKLNIKEDFKVYITNKVFIYVYCVDLNFTKSIWCDYYFKDDKTLKDFDFINAISSYDVRNIMMSFMELKIKNVELKHE